MNLRKRWLAACVAGAFTLTGAASAQAAQSLYPPDDAARTFDAGPAGYVGSTSSEGLCVPLLLCPLVTNSFESSGGVANSGYIKTSLGSLTGVGATSSGTWTSPAFVYNGVAGKAAKKLTMTVARRADVTALLSVAGNSATYSVELLDVSGGAGVSVINSETLAGLDQFADKSVAVDPSSLSLGGSYQVRITSRFESGVQVLPGGSADYDNVRLTAKRKSSGGGGGGGTGGGGGGGGTGGGGGGGALGSGGVVTIAGTAVLRGSKLLIKVRCARKPHARCKARVDARFRRRGPSATNRRVARVPAGKARQIALDVHPRDLAKLQMRKQIIVKQRSKQVGQPKAQTTYKLAKVRIR